MGTLAEQTAIVTGAGTGIGACASLRLAAEGAHVVLVGRRREPLEQTAAGIHAAGGSATVMPCDLEDGAAAAELGAAVARDRGRIDLLVNNAGHSSRVRSVRYVSPEEWDSVFKVNVEGVYRLTQAVLPTMLDAGRGTVVTIASVAAINAGMLGGASYGAAKSAVWSFMRSINAELRNEGIRACTILPAEVDTPILDNRPLPPDAAARATMMQPEDVADAIVFCATMPQRTLVEQITLLPTHARDVSADIAAARAQRKP
ncbi:MAG: SDR family oxidoreductase [Pseudomonadota bacterium]